MGSGRGREHRSLRSSSPRNLHRAAPRLCSPRGGGALVIRWPAMAPASAPVWHLASPSRPWCWTNLPVEMPGRLTAAGPGITGRDTAWVDWMLVRSERQCRGCNAAPASPEVEHSQFHRASL